MTNKEKILKLISIFNEKGWEEIFKLTSNKYKTSAIQEVVSKPHCQQDVMFDKSFNELSKLNTKFTNLKIEKQSITPTLETLFEILNDVLNGVSPSEKELQSYKICDKCKKTQCICYNGLYIVQVDYGLWIKNKEDLTEANLKQKFNYLQPKKSMVGLLDEKEFFIFKKVMFIPFGTEPFIVKKFNGFYKQ